MKEKKKRMNISSEACRLKHKYRGQNDFCLLCGDSLKWIKNNLEDYWVPVDAKPVIYEPDVNGRYVIYDRYHRKVPFAKVFGMNGSVIKKPLQGHIPHYFTCPVLKKRRLDWFRAKAGLNHDT